VSETGHFVDPSLFVPDATKDNYADAAKMAAKANGTTVAEEWAAIVAQFEANHQADGAAGWNHLAAWAKTADPETYGTAQDATELRKARELASAIQDPTYKAELDLESGEAAEAVEHAHATNRARQETGPGSPAGTDPAPVAPADEDANGPEKRASKRPTRNAAQSTPQENR